MRKFIYLLIMFILVGCSQNVIFSRDNLPSATIGKLYHVKINISGGTSAVRSIYATSTPDVLSVEGTQKDGWIDYNNLIIMGRPESIEDITIKISGNTAPTLFNPDPEFEKTYVIKVKEAE